MPDNGPLEDSHISIERAFLAESFVLGVGYGVQLVLYVMCVQYFWRERKRRRGVMLFLLAYVTLLLGLLSSWTAATIWAAEEVFINNRNYPGGPWAYISSPQYLPINIIFTVSTFSLTFLCDLLMLWRCWVIWHSSIFISRITTYTVVLFPFVTLLASFGLGIVWCLKWSPPGHPLYNRKAIILDIAYYMTSIGTNVIVTFLITLRLCLHRRKVLNVLPPAHAKQYLSIAAILVESAALHSATSLAFVISYALNNPLNPVFLGLSLPCQLIAGYLIILRVARGRAWGLNTLGVTSDVAIQLSSLSDTSAERMEIKVIKSFHHASTPESRTLTRSRSY